VSREKEEGDYIAAARKGSRSQKKKGRSPRQVTHRINTPRGEKRKHPGTHILRERKKKAARNPMRRNEKKRKNATVSLSIIGEREERGAVFKTRERKKEVVAPVL